MKILKQNPNFLHIIFIYVQGGSTMDYKISIEIIANVSPELIEILVVISIIVLKIMMLN